MESTQVCLSPNGHSREVWACREYCNSCTATTSADDGCLLALAAFTGTEMAVNLKTPQILVVNLGNRNCWMGEVVAALPCALHQMRG